MSLAEVPFFTVPQVPAMPANHDTLKVRVAVRNSNLAYLRKKRVRMVAWKMYLSVTEIDNRIHQLRVINRVDRELTYWYRKEDWKIQQGTRDAITSVEIFAKRGELINKFNYQFSKEAEAKLCQS